LAKDFSGSQTWLDVFGSSCTLQQSHSVNSRERGASDCFGCYLRHFQMEEARWTLYLPGICIHATHVPSESGFLEIHHENPSRPPNFRYSTFLRPPLTSHPAFRSPSPTDPSIPHTMASEATPPITPQNECVDGAALAQLISHDKAFENTSTSVAASQMRNALNNLADTVTDPEEKKVSPTPTIRFLSSS